MCLYLYKLFICKKIYSLIFKKKVSHKNCFTTKMHSESLFSTKETLDENWDDKSHCWDWNGNVESQCWGKHGTKKKHFG